MIYVPKGPSPAALNTLEVTQKTLTLAQKAAAMNNGGDKIKGGDFDSDVWNDRAGTVKDQLIKEHRGKCAYCEARILDVSDGEIEHFRPKTEYKTMYYAAKGRSPTQPGYWWLAYDYRNMHLSCPTCNRVYKGTVFPLKFELRQNPIQDQPPLGELPNPQSHDPIFLGKGTINQGFELAIDPSAINPRTYLCFDPRTAMAMPTQPDNVDVVLRAGTTVNLFGLNRPELVQSRKEHLKKLRGLFLFAQLRGPGGELVHPEQEAAKRAITYAVTQHAEFSSLAIDAIAAWQQTPLQVPQNNQVAVQANVFWLDFYVDAQNFEFRRRGVAQAEEQAASALLRAAAAVVEFPALVTLANKRWDEAWQYRNQGNFEACLMSIKEAGNLYTDACGAYNDIASADDKAIFGKDRNYADGRVTEATALHQEWYEAQWN